MKEYVQKILEYLQAGWNYLEIPVRWALAQFGVTVNENYMFILVIAEIFLGIFVFNLILGLLFTDLGTLVPRGGSKFVRKLKRSKNYIALGSYYAERGNNKQAIKWFTKAGAHKRAAEQAAAAGKIKLAAKLYADNGLPELAAELFGNSGNWPEAARYFEAAGNPARAADAWRRAGDTDAAATALGKAFEGKEAIDEAEWKSAERLLADHADEVRPHARKSLARSLADAAPASTDLQRIGELYELAGMVDQAAEKFASAGAITRAMRCYEQAGNDKGAASMRGRKLEREGNYAEAAKEYEFAEAWVQAGQCYEQAEEYEKAAKCFEAVGDPYHAAEGYAANRQWDQAIRALQAIPSDHQDYYKSRLLLGRCFFEMGDYRHCAAALENELLQKSVTRQNMDNFYMMAMAYEQLGRLEDARNILYRIHTVDVSFRDVSHRISEIGSRISLEIRRGERPPMGEEDDEEVVLAGAHGSGVVAPPGGISKPAAAKQTQVAQNSVRIFANRYRIEKELGRGGMGVVYKAHDTQLDRAVALKFLGTVQDDKRFLREARVAAKLSHPNIVAVYDFDGTEGQSYLAMEFIEGQGLDNYVEQHGRLSPRESVNIVKQICGALTMMHDSGIVHRDIKPANILMGKAGIVKLTDFGLAKGGERSHQITGSGLAVGTPAYMPPEQVLGKNIDVRSDLYALGLVLYECMLGREVFSSGDILERQLNEVPPKPSEAGIEAPPELDDIVMKAIEKDPDDRFQSAEEFREALRGVRHA